MIIDSIIVPVYSNISNEPSPGFNTVLFLCFVIIFSFTNYVLIGYSKHNFLQSKYISARSTKIFFWSIVLTQCIVAGMLVLLVTELLALRSYDLSVVVLLVYVSHISAIAYLTFLTYQFLSWFRSIHNFVVLLYTCAFSLLIINLILSRIFLAIATSYADPIIKLRSVRTAIRDSSTPLISLSGLATTYDYVSISSFIFAWIPTIILLKTYSVRFGKLNYWILVTVPVVYFLIPFLFDELGTIDDLRLEYGRQFNLIYNIFFSPYKQVGGLLFGLAFFMTAIRIKREDLRTQVMISGIGMMLLFGFTVIHGLTYVVSPPFGIVTVSFVSLASYLLFIGIFASSSELAKDALVRKELSRIAGEQVSLLRNIGAAEIEKTLLKKIKPIMEKTTLTEDTNSPYSTNEEDLKEMVKEVISELKASRKI